MDEALLRNLTLLVPVLAVTGTAVVRHRRGELRARVAAAVLATLLAWVGLLAVEGAGSWWTFVAGPTTVLGMPLETSLGWALAWGALPVLGGGAPGWWGLGFAWVDLLLVPRLAPLVVLGDHWLVGEAVLLGLVAAPALVLGWATRRSRWLAVRVVLQGVTFAGLVGWAAPSLALARDGLGWGDVLDHGFLGRGLLLMAGVVVGVPVLAAVAELARVGGGTPFPWDPPDRLVTTGPYAYLSNPMQAGAVLLLLILAVAAGSVTLLIGVGVAVVFSVAVADRHEATVLAERWADYRSYRRAVRPWLPRRRPLVAGTSTLWVSQTCGLCRETGDAVALLAPEGLALRSAEESPTPLQRMRWSGPAGHDDGVAALARALEQAGLGWAWVGWLVRLPVLVVGIQAVADACGLGPRQLPLRTVSS